MSAAPIVRRPEEIDGAWLGAALGREGVELLGTERIGTGQMSQSHRIRFRASGGEEEETVVVKLASEDPLSRATGTGMGAYYREIAFYRNLAARIGGPVPRCHLAEYDDAAGWFTLLLEDIAAGTQGDQIAGCGVEEATAALRALARVHGPVLGDLALGSADWLNLPSPLTQAVLTQLLPGFLERYGGRIAPEHSAVCERFVPSLAAWAADRRPPLGLIHGDYRLDNLLFAGDACHVVDWQTVGWGPTMVDCAYFIGGGLEPAERRAHEEALLRVYHDGLLEQGVEGFSFDRCFEEYRRATFHGLVMTIAASMVVERTERGDEMFMTWLRRNAQQVLDLDALDLLPAPDTAKPAPLRPEPADEGRHAPGPEELWNESWYFDGVADDASLGLYVRLGRLPNLDVALYTVAVCGPGRDTVMLVDAAAPLPGAEDDAQRIESGGLVAEQRCEAPLERFRVHVVGVGAAFADAAAPLRGEEGAPIPLALDLAWETTGVPYAWRQATRYEIPCRVSGTVRVGEEEIAFAGPGQRDHSWGSRDWWAVDWMWSAFHLEDGTHTHAVGVPQMPGYGVGYVQRDSELEEITAVTASEEIADDGLVTRGRIESGPPELALEIEPLAFGPLRLEAPDGRVSLFPRAMARVTAGDGRRGTGWIEWNRVQPGP